MVTEPLICLFGKCVLCGIFAVRANYTKIPILHAVSCLDGVVLPTASVVVNNGISNSLCVSIANNVSLGVMAYRLGVTVSKKNP